MKKLMIIILMGIIAIIPFNAHAYDVPIYQLDQSVSELNGLTLKEVFEDGNVISNPDFITSSNWVQYGISSAISFNYAIIFDGIATTYNGYYQDISLNTGDSLYYRYNQYYYSGDKINHTIYDYQTFNNGLDLRVDSVSGENSIVFDSKINGIRIFFQEILDFVYDYTFINQLCLIDLTSLGISHLTVEQMDYYYKYYQLALQYELDNKEAVKDEGNYKHIFMSIYEGLMNLMKSMGSVWTFLSTPIINSNITEMGQLFNIDWSWNIFDIFRQLITDLALFVLQLNTYIVSSLFFALGIPINISILSLVFSDFVFVVLTWIIFKSFII